MKSIFTLALVSALTVGLSAQGIEFFHGTYAEALEKAKKEEKMVFIDCFTEWCGPCKRMAATTFKDPEAGAFFNDNFINFKSDMEKGEGPDLAQKFNVSAYPTLVFVDATGKIQKKQVGGQSVEGLLALGRAVLGRNDAIANYEKLYEEEGKRDPETVIGYIKALNRAGKPSLKVANDYLKTQTDLSSEANLRFLFEALSEADSKIFDLFIERRAQIEALEKPVLVENKIEKACAATVRKAIEFRNKSLLNEAKAKAKANIPSRFADFEAKADLDYAVGAKDESAFCDCLKKRAKAAGNDALRLNDVAGEALKNFPDSPAAQKLALKCAKKAAQNGGLPEYWLTYGELLARAGKKSEALKAALRAKQIAVEKKPGLVPSIERLIESIGAPSEP